MLEKTYTEIEKTILNDQTISNADCVVLLKVLRENFEKYQQELLKSKCDDLFNKLSKVEVKEV